MKRILRSLKSASASCPYTMLGKKVVETAAGKSKPQQAAGAEPYWRSTVRTGRNIAIIGVFCPFFWISLFSGASAPMIRFNAVHSAIVILIGLLVMAFGYWTLRRTRGTAVQPVASASNTETRKGQYNEIHR